MQPLDLNVLTLIVGLSVYISSIRFVVLSRLLGDLPLSESKKNSYKSFLRWLIPADALFLVAGVSLFLMLFWKHLLGGEDPNHFSLVIVWAFSLVWHGWSSCCVLR
ncbi:MAG: hypothetical protein CV089_21825 [Nitrospira sp. WS110]|nr:hypothetical protein [Nitrospira sp. WS110]